MTERVRAGGLQVARVLHDFVNEEALPGTGVSAEAFWPGLERIVAELAPINRALLDKRDRLQQEIDAWHRERRDRSFELAEYKAFLTRDRLPAAGGAGLLDLDGECRRRDLRDRRAAARRAGHQCALCAERRQCPLGQPLRRALRHRRNSRRPTGRSAARGYNPARGQKVIAYARALLDEAAPLVGRLVARRHRLPHRSRAAQSSRSATGRTPDLAASRRLRRLCRARRTRPTAILLKNHGLHLELRDRPRITRSAATMPAGIADIVAGIGDHDDHGLRGFDRRRRRRRQGRSPTATGSA